jgi:2-polyprenyl-3-methyl-5-hydroxy-6-metoxy-1,4-benzoquinol methylase
LFRYPASSLKELDDLYKTSWGDANNQLEETGATSPELAQEYVRQLAKSLGIENLEGLRILDYGAGRGAMIKALLDAGADVCAVEPFGYEVLQKNGFKVFCSLTELPKGFTFDGIVSLDVVEHVPVPWDDYKNLKEFLAENGWLYISTPNAAGINAQYFKVKWRELYNRGHLFFFTPATLKDILKKCGYKNIIRLRWFINYHRSSITLILHWPIQFLQIDGELRFLAFK